MRSRSRSRPRLALLPRLSPRCGPGPRPRLPGGAGAAGWPLSAAARAALVWSILTVDGASPFGVSDNAVVSPKPPGSFWRTVAARAITRPRFVPRHSSGTGRSCLPPTADIPQWARSFAPASSRAQNRLADRAQRPVARPETLKRCLGPLCIVSGPQRGSSWAVLVRGPPGQCRGNRGRR